ncbi:MAG: V-type ATPase subunit [Clostridiales bacterium]|mgnify:CR=1 FL=1|nr:V-type ATPase subunit [Clostridiales bacterium]
MGSLTQYSGLTTKIRAMKGHLLTKDEYLKLAELSSVSEFVDNLKKYKYYSEIFADIDSAEVHRGTMEKLLIYGVYKDYGKIYNFANINQRKFLKLYFIRYEVNLIKRAISGLNYEDNLSYYDQAEVLFSKYSDIDISSVYNAKNVEGIIEALKGTIYFEPLKQVQSYVDPQTFDYAMTLDLFFFKYAWRKRKQFKGSEFKSVTDSIGSEVDSLNILWIYRAKKYYRLDSAKIYEIIIPVYFRLKKDQVRALVEASDYNEFKDIIKKTAFGRYLEDADFDKENLDRAYKKVIEKLYNKYFKLDPYSLSAINSYLYSKQEEVHRLISIAESIRYGYKLDAIASEII